MIDDDFPPPLRVQSNPDVQRLLDEVRGDGPTAEQVAATVAGAVAAANASHASSTSFFGMAKWTKVLLAIGSTGLVAAGVAVALVAAQRPASPITSPTTARPREIAPVTTPEDSVQPPLATAAPPIETTTPVHRAPIIATTTSAAPELEDDAASMTVELRRVMQIRSRMLAKDPSAALADVDAYEHDYPHGAFTQEAEAMAIEALHDSGRNDEAKLRADRFLAHYPSAPQAARIRTLRDAL